MSVMMIVDNPELKTDVGEMPLDVEADPCSERARKAFAAMLDGVDVEDVFGEFIVPSTPAPPGAKQNPKA
jgi:hypothetical protein